MPGFRCDVPARPTIQHDDAHARITRWDFAPGAATGWHRHGWPYFVVMLADATLRLHNGTEEADAQFSAGRSYMRPAGVEHDVMNVSLTSIAFIEIELKTLKM
jgi:quercetin dioxygenase-like cupin family protein